MTNEYEELLQIVSDLADEQAELTRKISDLEELVLVLVSAVKLR